MRDWLRSALDALLLTLAVVLGVSLLMAPAAAQAVPTAALKHRADLVRNARSVWGLGAPVAVFAAQVHQESAWRADAVSRVGAQGLAQFMPATARWISGVYPELAAQQPYSPAWALRALVQYDRWLWDRIGGAADDCQRMAFALSAYNGGLGWVVRDRSLAAQRGLDAARLFDQVERVNAGRSAANWHENRGYPRRILLTLAPVYAAAGWGPSTC